MKTFPSFRRTEHGSTLLIAVAALATISFLLVSYLNLTAGVNRSVVRSQAWNDALSTAEAGIEEALMNMNLNGPGGMTKPGTGWETSGSTNALTYRYLTYDWANRDYRYYVAYASTNGTIPVIRSHGAAYLPGAYGTNSGQWVWRRIEVRAIRGSRFPKGMIAKSFINMNGNNITTDSYDSADPAYSTPDGRYDPTKTKQNGDLGTNLSVDNSVNVGNANIKGNVATGPGGTVAIGPGGFITGTVTHDMNVDFPDILPPFTTAPGLVGGTTNTYAVPPGDTLVGSLSMSGGNSMLITGPGLTRLYFTGNFSMTGSAYIQLAPGAKLEIYMGGATAKIAGNGVLSPTGKATDVSYFGLPGNTSVDFSGNGEFTGTIYAPNAAFTASGGGKDLYDLAGAVVVKTITLNGHFNLHYDEALGRISSPDGVTVISWREF